MADAAYLAFRRTLAAAIAETLEWWQHNHPGQPFDPGTLTGLCPRRFPVNRAGLTLLSLDERLWERGRARYGAHR